MILGFDEVGRGSLAGPVTVGLVALPVNYPLHTHHTGLSKYSDEFESFKFVRDSKRLKPPQRQAACQLITTKQLPHCTLSASNHLIDQYGIGVCLRHLLLIGYNRLVSEHITTLYVDGRVYLPASTNDGLLTQLLHDNDLNLTSVTFPQSQVHIINEDKADDTYLAIALASCLAKVKRDRFMEAEGERYPVYNWVKNKGYATNDHRSAIRLNPDNHLIRRTFINNILKEKL